MAVASQFGGGMPLGSIAFGVDLPEPLYVRADARTCSRAGYPRLSTKYPFGKLTGTIRTLAGVPSNLGIAASPTYFVANAVSSPQGLQYSADGVTWSTAALVVGSGAISCVIWAGTRFVAVYQPGVTPYVTTGDNPNSNWVATTGGFSAVPAGGLNALAYSPTLGRVVSVQGSAVNNVQTLDNGSTVWVSRAGLPNRNLRGVCWTGSKFLAIVDGTNIVATSADGITWTDVVTPEALIGGQGGIASNGNGIVVISGTPTGLYVSLDHGVTWASAPVPGLASAADQWRINYSGDRFFLATTLGIAMSPDGKNWFIDPHGAQARVLASVFAKKGAVIVQMQLSATAYSFSESATDFVVHNLQTYSPAVSGNPVAFANAFIKAL